MMERCICIKADHEHHHATHCSEEPEPNSKICTKCREKDAANAVAKAGIDQGDKESRR